MSTRKTNILLADDDYLNYLFLREILSSAEFNIVYVENGFKAVEECRVNKDIDLILMDLKMPNLSGTEAIEKIRSFNKDVPIIVQSAYSDKSELDSIKGFDRIYFLHKPYNEEVLVEKVRGILNDE